MWLLQIFGQILDQGQAFMSQMTANHEGTRVTILGRVSPALNGPFLEFSTLSSEFSWPSKRIPKGSRAILCKVTDHWQLGQPSPLN